jgi:hypothetical protein
MTYPILMRNVVHNYIVLFYKPKIGTVVNAENCPVSYIEVGYHYEGWDMTKFEIHNRPVTLENVK